MSTTCNDHHIFSQNTSGTSGYRRDCKALVYFEDSIPEEDLPRTKTDEVMLNEQGRNIPHCSNAIQALEERIKEMEAHLIQEREVRKSLEKRVASLEAENSKLSILRSTAASQLQSFSEKFFSFSEPLKCNTPDPILNTPPLSASPLSSRCDLHRSESNSKFQNRLSLQSMKSLKARYSNVSL